MSRPGSNPKRVERDVSKAITPTIVVRGIARIRDDHGNVISGWVAFEATLPVDVVAAGTTRTTEPLTHAEACGWIEDRMRDEVGR